MFPIERTTSFHSPSGIKNTGDDVEEEEPRLVILRGFRRTLQLIENIAEVRRRRRSGLLH